jgi:hypothetical protein
MLKVIGYRARTNSVQIELQSAGANPTHARALAFEIDGELELR